MKQECPEIVYKQELHEKINAYAWNEMSFPFLYHNVNIQISSRPISLIHINNNLFRKAFIFMFLSRLILILLFFQNKAKFNSFTAYFPDGLECNVIMMNYSSSRPKRPRWWEWPSLFPSYFIFFFVFSFYPACFRF